MDLAVSSALTGEIAALATAGCWVVTSLAFARAGERVGSLPVNFIRLLLALPMLSLLTRVLRGHLVPLDASGDAWLWLSISGVVGFVLGDMCLFRAFVLLGPRLSSLVMSTAPLITALIGYWVLGETLGVGAMVGMLLTIAGVAWAVCDRRASGAGIEGKRGRGVLLALGGALGQALGLILSKRGMGAFDAFAATQIRVLAGLGAWTLIFAATGRWAQLRSALRHRSAMRSIVVGAFWGPVVGVGLSLLAVQNANAGVAASLMSIAPILLIPISVIFLRERVGVGSVVGTAVAVTGVVVLFLV